MQKLTVPVRGDVLDELEERYFVDLSNPVVAIITDEHGIGTIVDDDRNGGFTCRASGLRGDQGPNVEPSVANAPNQPCKAESKSTSRLNLLSVSTSQTPADLTSAPPAAGDNSTAHADATNLTLNVGLNIIKLTALSADARAECTAGGPTAGPPKLTSSSRVTALAVNGQPVVVTTATINVPLILATLWVNQKIVGPDRGHAAGARRRHAVRAGRRRRRGARGLQRHRRPSQRASLHGVGPLVPPPAPRGRREQQR